MSTPQIRSRRRIVREIVSKWKVKLQSGDKYGAEAQVKGWERPRMDSAYSLTLKFRLALAQFPEDVEGSARHVDQPLQRADDGGL